MAGSRRVLTDTFIRGLISKSKDKKTRPAKRVYHWDATLPCFGVKATPAGSVA
jgi:hypothetical protein